MNTCFFCGRPANTDRGDICAVHERKIMSPNAEILRTRPGGPGQSRRHRHRYSPDVDNPVRAF